MQQRIAEKTRTPPRSVVTVGHPASYKGCKTYLQIINARNRARRTNGDVNHPDRHPRPQHTNPILPARQSSFPTNSLPPAQQPSIPTTAPERLTPTPLPRQALNPNPNSTSLRQTNDPKLTLTTPAKQPAKQPSPQPTQNPSFLETIPTRSPSPPLTREERRKRRTRPSYADFSDTEDETRARELKETYERNVRAGAGASKPARGKQDTQINKKLPQNQNKTTECNLYQMSDSVKDITANFNTISAVLQELNKGKFTTKDKTKFLHKFLQLYKHTKLPVFIDLMEFLINLMCSYGA